LEICSKISEEEIHDFNFCSNENDNDTDPIPNLPLNAVGVIRYYQDFVHSFLSNINLIVIFEEFVFFLLLKCILLIVKGPSKPRVVQF